MSEDAWAGISARTGLVVILGHPVAHSRSPQMHNAAFRHQQIDLVYLAFDVPPAQLRTAVEGLRALGAVGANVTVPHKEAICPLLDSLESSAERVGAVNTIVNRAGVLVGSNTDVYGFLSGLERGWGRGPAGAGCLVLGAGGAARAVVSALAGEKAAEILIYNRTEARAEQLCEATARWSTVPCRVVREAELGEAVAGADLIVNATSVGMGDTVKLAPIPVDMLSGRHVVMDLVYSPRHTALLQHAQAVGAITIDGTEMLVRQAVRSYELWTGSAAPVEIMRREVLRN